MAEKGGCMFKLLSVTRARGGKVREAVGAMKALAEFVKSKHDLRLEVHIQLFGPSGTLYMVGDVPDLATFQTVQAKIMADEAYWALVQKAAEVMEPPTMVLLQRV
jgi:hypothetical protein